MRRLFAVCVFVACGSQQVASDGGLDATVDVFSTDASPQADVAADADAASRTLVLGKDTSCLLDGTTLKCWGANYASQLALPWDKTTHPIPVTLPIAPSSAAMAWHSCAIVGGQTWCWGANPYDQLGHDEALELEAGTDADNCSGSPCNATAFAVTSLFDASAVSVGQNSSCAIVSGSVVCWGWNGSGELGSWPLEAGTPCSGFCTPSPIMVPGSSGAVEIATSTNFACARKADGSVWCWGDNYYGEMGIGTTDNQRHAPSAVSGVTGATRLATGNSHACVIVGGGSVSCWGWNAHGQAGQDPVSSATCANTDRCALALVSVPGIASARDICGGYDWTCALTAAGSVWCWGGNDLDFSPDGGTINPAPVQITGLTNVDQIACGWSHACARVRDGSVWCWGANYSGQIGLADGGVQSALPVAVQQL